MIIKGQFVNAFWHSVLFENGLESFIGKKMIFKAKSQIQSVIFDLTKLTNTLLHFPNTLFDNKMHCQTGTNSQSNFTNHIHKL